MNLSEAEARQIAAELRVPIAVARAMHEKGYRPRRARAREAAPAPAFRDRKGIKLDTRPIDAPEWPEPRLPTTMAALCGLRCNPFPLDVDVLGGVALWRDDFAAIGHGIADLLRDHPARSVWWESRTHGAAFRFARTRRVEVRPLRSSRARPVRLREITSPAGIPIALALAAEFAASMRRAAPGTVLDNGTGYAATWTRGRAVLVVPAVVSLVA